MAEAGSFSGGAIQFDLACPNCSYNLRGLAAADCVCPECGLVVEVAALIKARARKPRGHASMKAPIIWFVFGGIACFLIAAAMMVHAHATHWNWDWLVPLAVHQVVWLVLLAICRLQLDGVAGLLRTLVMYAVVLGYMAIALGGPLLIVAVWTLLPVGPLVRILLSALVVGAALGVIRGCNRLERRIALYFLRRHRRGVMLSDLPGGGGQG